MTSDTKQELLYLVIENMLGKIDELLRKQMTATDNIRYVIDNHLQEFNDTEKKQLHENLDGIEYQFQVFRDYVNSANKCLELLSLPPLECKWVVVLDENNETKIGE